jgi:diaminopimelate epimerase
MITVPFAKLHGAENDFLLSWGEQTRQHDFSEIARRICSRNTGIGADGWMLVWRETGGLRTRLFNADGSEPEISGNGTRCAAAFALLNDAALGPKVVITTAAGPKTLRLISRDGHRFIFEMDMGLPVIEELRAIIELAGDRYNASILNVGNPQCAIFVKEMPRDWRAVAAEAEGHPRFPKRSNVSFVQVLDRQTINVLFYERGVGETRSSGTGSTGAAVAAILKGDVIAPVEIITPAGTLSLRWEDSVYLTGPAEFIAEGRFFLDF